MFVAAFSGKVTILSPNLDPGARGHHVTFRVFFRLGPKKRPGEAQGDPKGSPGSAQGTQKGSWGICLGHGGGKAAGNWIKTYINRRVKIVCIQN